jgi:hypothetical protein
VQPSECESDEGLEAVFRFLVTGGESAKTFEFAEATFDAIALFVEIFVVLALTLRFRSGGITALAPMASTCSTMAPAS